MLLLSACAALQRPQLDAMSLPAPFEQGFLDITGYRFMEEFAEDSRSAGDKPLGPECTGIVLHSLFGGAEQVSPQSNRPVVYMVICFKRLQIQF